MKRWAVVTEVMCKWGYPKPVIVERFDDYDKAKEFAKLMGDYKVMHRKEARKYKR